jgi:hypothetical protein
VGQALNQINGGAAMFDDKSFSKSSFYEQSFLFLQAVSKWVEKIYLKYKLTDNLYTNYKLSKSLHKKFKLY